MLVEGLTQVGELTPSKHMIAGSSQHVAQFSPCGIERGQLWSCAFAAPAAAAATAWPLPCESNARGALVGAVVTAVAASRPKTNETAAAAIRMPMALLDLDFLCFMRGVASSNDAGIVLSVLVMM